MFKQQRKTLFLITSAKKSHWRSCLQQRKIMLKESEGKEVETIDSVSFPPPLFSWNSIHNLAREHNVATDNCVIS